ncbi:hypothetical protein [Capsulimonas corticalis]|uniref:hypothetical protein n=1 Tax=Capsulimonas corticalis TaxID=2219043 RepID=UPI000F64676B|nr:hypothetical protein [Capsulimonas corticalis]
MSISQYDGTALTNRHMRHSTDTCLEELHAIARRFRFVMEHIRDRDIDLPSGLGILKHFPICCCDKTCVLLVRYLAERGYSQARSVNAMLIRDTTCRHEWVEVDGVIIDITADQFKARPKQLPVIVSDHSTFHLSYRRAESRQYTSGWTDWNYNEDFRRDLEEFYAVVVQLMDEPTVA